MQRKGKFKQLKQWWMKWIPCEYFAVRTTLIQHPKEEIDHDITELLKVEGQTITFKTQSIGRIYDYQRIVLPQEMQIKIAYESLIERFSIFLQQENCAIRLSENAFKSLCLSQISTFNLRLSGKIYSTIRVFGKGIVQVVYFARQQPKVDG